MEFQALLLPLFSTGNLSWIQLHVLSHFVSMTTLGNQSKSPIDRMSDSLLNVSFTLKTIFPMLIILTEVKFYEMAS